MPDQPDAQIVRIQHDAGRKPKLALPADLAQKYAGAEFVATEHDEGILYRVVAWPGRSKPPFDLASLDPDQRRPQWLKGQRPGEILAQLRALAEELGHSPTGREWQRWEKRHVDDRRVRAAFGGWYQALDLAGLPPSERPTPDMAHRQKIADGNIARNTLYTDEQLLDLLRDCARELGRTPGATAFNAWRGYHAAQLLARRFGSWGKACELAGLQPRAKPHDRIGNRRFTDEAVRSAYLRIRAITGHPPTMGEWDKLVRRGEPGGQTIRLRYRSWMPFLAAMEALDTRTPVR